MSDSPEKKRGKRRMVELDAEMYRKIGVIASWLDVSIPDWVNARLKSLVDAAFAETVGQIAGPAAEPKKPKK